jgi:hypothetical protein
VNWQRAEMHVLGSMGRYGPLNSGSLGSILSPFFRETRCILALLGFKLE